MMTSSKTVSAVIIALIAAMTAMAGDAGAVISMGATAGLNFASLDDIEVGDSKSTYDGRTGYHLGGYVETGLGPLAARAGLLYVNAGPLFNGLSEIPGVPADFDDDFDVKFFAIPIDVMYRMVTPMVTPYLVGGPEFRFNTGAPDQFKDNFQSSIIMGSVGVGVKIGAPGAGISISPELRYEFGVDSLVEDQFEIGDTAIKAASGQDLNAWVLRVNVGF